MSRFKPFLIAAAMLALILLSCIDTSQAAREYLDAFEPGINKSTTTASDMWYVSILSRTWSVLHTKIGTSSMLPKAMFGWQIGSGVKRTMTPKPANPNSQTPAVATTTAQIKSKTSPTIPPSSTNAPLQKKTTSPTPPTTTTSTTTPPQPKKTSETPPNQPTETINEKKNEPPDHDPNTAKMDPSAKSTMAISAKTPPLVSTTSN